MAESRDLHAEILTTAKNLFIQRGYHGLAMREISEALGVTKPALYYHFKDKEELFLAVLKIYLDEMETALDQITAEPASCRDKIRQFIEYVLSQPAEQRALIRLASQEMGHLSAASRKAFDRVYREKFIGKVETILRTGMETGEIQSIQPEVATHTLLGMMYPYFYPSRAGDKGLSVETIQQVVSIYLDGVSRK
jgi:AcrR family transcriptional regulator